MSQIGVLNRMPVDAKPVDRCRHIDRVPRDHRVGQEVQAGRLVHLFFLLLPPDLAPVGKEQELSQGVQRFPLVELGVDPAPELLALQIPQDEDRLDQTAVFQQGTGQGVLTAVGLEPADQQRGGDLGGFRVDLDMAFVVWAKCGFCFVRMGFRRQRARAWKPMRLDRSVS